MDARVIKEKRKAVYRAVTEGIEAGVDPVYRTWADQLLKSREAPEVLASLLAYCFGKELESQPGVAKAERSGVRLFVARGRTDGLTVRKLVGMVIEKIPIKAKHITDVQILDTFAFMTVPEAKAERIVEAFHVAGEKPLVDYESSGLQNGGS